MFSYLNSGELHRIPTTITDLKHQLEAKPKLMTNAQFVHLLLHYFPRARDYLRKVLLLNVLPASIDNTDDLVALREVFDQSFTEDKAFFSVFNSFSLAYIYNMQSQLTRAQMLKAQLLSAIDDGTYGPIKKKSLALCVTALIDQMQRNSEKSRAQTEIMQSLIDLDVTLKAKLAFPSLADRCRHFIFNYNKKNPEQPLDTTILAEETQHQLTHYTP
jgi:hypothetical protein